MSSQNTPITATQFAPDSTAASDPSNSATAGGRYQPSLDSPGPTLYYGAVALAVFACVLLAAATRFYLLRKKDRRRTAQRLESERSDLERRGEDGGLPTYTQSTTLPGYAETRQERTPFFSLPRLPVSLHLRSRRALPKYDGPPKYAVTESRESGWTVDRPDASLAREAYEQEFIHPEEARRRENQSGTRGDEQV